MLFFGKGRETCLLFLDGGDNPPRGTAGANDVLVGNGEEVPLVNGELGLANSDGLHVADHV